MVKLSICITVYNQRQLIQWNVENLLRYPGDDIEIILQDDGSTEDIAGLLLEYNDPRLKYYRNPVNLGHDKNIIAAFRHCAASHAFLLRSSDTVLPEKIGQILAFIERYPDVGYCRFTCVNHAGRIRVAYRDAVCPPGAKSAALHRKTLIHPSGELYNLRYFSETDWACLTRYLDAYFDHNRKFVVHLLMREKLAQVAGLATSAQAVWLYADTLTRKDVAENRTDNRLSVYDPRYQYQRYHCEMSYLVNELSGEAKYPLMNEVFDRYAWLIVFVFRYFNQDQRLHAHYQSEEVAFSSREERRRFIEKSLAFAAEYPQEERRWLEKKARSLHAYKLAAWQLHRRTELPRAAVQGVFRRIYRLSKGLGGSHA